MRPRENSGYFLMMKPNERTSANQEVKYMLLGVSNLGHLSTFARVTRELNKPKSCLLDVFYLRLNDDISPVVPRPVVTLSK